MRSRRIIFIHLLAQIVLSYTVFWYVKIVWVNRHFDTFENKKSLQGDTRTIRVRVWVILGLSVLSSSEILHKPLLPSRTLFHFRDSNSVPSFSD